MENQSPEEEARVKQMIDELIEKAKIASQEYLKLNQETVDNITRMMSMAGLEHHMELAKMAIEETGRGIYEDKITKNMFATEYIYHSIKYEKTVGIINENDEDDFVEIAEPVGIIAGVTPVTNPTSTTMFKSIIAAKTRNVIVFGFHPSAQKCSVEAARIMREAAIKAGAPENCILWIEEPSILATRLLMNHPDVNLILATGGTGMVKAAYSCGKPALGVGPGNVPCYINKTAKLKTSVNDLVLSKSFDNGMICASEQAVLVDKDIYQEFEKLMREAGCYFVNPEEKEMLKNSMFETIGGYKLKSHVPGKSPAQIAKEAGFDVPEDTKVLVVYEEGIGEEHPFSKEKLSPVLTYYIVKDEEEGIDKSERLIEFGGLGHSAVIHAEDKEIILKFSKTMKAGRIIVNSPSTHGAIGDIYNTNMPSLTLGCGSFGGNSTTANVSSVNLINIKRVAKRRVNMQWFKVPEKIYFEAGSISYLEKMPNIERAFIVTDEGMQKLGYVDKILYHLRKREKPVHCEIFSEVESDPSFDTVNKGVEAMNNFNPDVIIALGGGSPIDAAKGMWLFYENPDADPEGLKLKFMDIRKRTYKFPKMGSKSKMVAIPTTSGTGSEVTSFAVITDKVKNKKYPLADYELTPDVAIIDPDLVMSLPKTVTADTGMDVLTHALEAYVSVMASDYTDALSEKAVELVFNYLKEAYEHGGNKLAREKMHNASTIAGMSFTNAFLGVAHSMAHKIGAEFHLPHGRINAIILPYVIKYNATKPSKFVSWPKYEFFIADEKYAKMAKIIGLKSDTVEEGVESLINAVKKLNEDLNIPKCFKDAGIDENEFLAKIDLLSDRAFEDQCTTANPRVPLVSEIKQILLDSYYGK
ncbi:MAG: bifunctional acetaldehyde-CoA/alcohol dehydrogenase [Clostridia bacterium]|jgi:acetaldehyde dehydrogenase/alcohol dehydrogenase|nr:bifunctional acetaldehyde-CoA/alcohol dehydrogenase [Clostridia bacterium]